MRNPRITKKEMGLIKGALRRVFGRSELRRKVIDSHILTGYHDPKRKRVKYWVKCELCGCWEAKSNIQLDHFHPVVPIDSSFEQMSVDEVIDRMWCEENYLQPLCKTCHKQKTLDENKERRRIKKEGK